MTTLILFLIVLLISVLGGDAKAPHMSCSGALTAPPSTSSPQTDSICDEEGVYSAATITITIAPQFRETVREIDPDRILVETGSFEDTTRYTGATTVALRLNDSAIGRGVPFIHFFDLTRLEAIYEEAVGRPFPTITWLQDVLQTRPTPAPRLPQDPQMFPEFLLASWDDAYIEFEGGAGIRALAVYDIHNSRTYNYMFYGVQTCSIPNPTYVMARIPLLNVGEAIGDAGIDAWYRRSNPLDDPEIAAAVAQYDAMFASLRIDGCMPNVSVEESCNR